MTEYSLAQLGKEQVILIDGIPANAQEIYEALKAIEQGQEFKVLPIRAGTWNA